MKVKKLHRWVGIALLLPMLAWPITGFIFLVKPGYKNAYESISIRFYPIEQPLSVKTKNGWEEVRFVKTILGHHLIARDHGGWKHFDPVSLNAISMPDSDVLTRLVEDAVTSNKARYGQITHSDGNIFYTDTGTELTLDWSTLSLKQKGSDTRLIGLFYKIHYLQWTPFEMINQVLGVLGLILLLFLTALGFKLSFTKRTK